jgi:hypothetical protein
MSKPQQVDEQPVDEVKTNIVRTGQKGQNVMPSAEPERSAKQEVLDDSDDEEEYITFDWNRGSDGRLRGYYLKRSKPTSTRHSQGANVHSASTADKDASVGSANDDGSQIVTIENEPSSFDSQS